MPDTRDCRNCAHVVNMQTTPSEGHDAFGEVENGSMQIACSSMLSGQITSREKVVVHSHDEDISISCEVDCVDDCGANEGRSCWILPIFERPYGSHGLLLGGVAPGVFRRMGSYEVCISHGYWRSFVKVLEKEGRQVASSQCAEIIGNAKYPRETFVITIV